MDEIKTFITQQISVFQKKSLRRNSIGITLSIKNYNDWINTIKNLMKSCKYREAIKQIEEKKNIFCNLKDSWKYEILEIECILKIIKKKLSKYSKEIQNKNTHQNHSILFWFNQIFYILEFLTLKIRPDINSMINLKDETFINIIEYIIQVHVNTLYTLCLYSKLIEEIPQVCSYFAMTERLLLSIDYIRYPKTLNLFQKILLLRANLFIENLDFENSLKYQKLSNDICFREFFLLIDFDTGLNAYNIQESKKTTNFIYTNIINMVLCFYLRGVCFEIFGNLNLSIEAYKQGRWLCEKFLTNKQPEFTFFMKKIEKRNYFYYNILKDIEKEIQIVKIEKFLKEGEKMKNKEQSKYEERESSDILRKISSGNSIKNFGELENILEKIGSIELKDIENNKYYLGKSKKSKFILSTISMINNLLSDNFNDILCNMKKIEINKMDQSTKKIIDKRLEDLERTKSSIKIKSPKYNKKNLVYLKLDDENNIHQKKDNINHIKYYNNLSIKIKKRRRSVLIKGNDNNKINSFISNCSLSKNNLKKKNYLEKLCKKEIDFHKENLYAKRFEIEPEIEKFNREKVNSKAKNIFDLKLILVNYQHHKKSSLKTMIKNSIIDDNKNSKNDINKNIHFEPLYHTYRNNSSNRLSLTSQIFLAHFKNNDSIIKVDKKSVNSSNLDIIKQLNKETNYLNKSIKEKHKLIKSCSSGFIKPKIYIMKKK